MTDLGYTTPSSTQQGGTVTGSGELATTDLTVRIINKGDASELHENVDFRVTIMTRGSTIYVTVSFSINPNVPVGDYYLRANGANGAGVYLWSFSITPKQYRHSLGYNSNGGEGTMQDSIVTDTNSGYTAVTSANCAFTPPANHAFIGWDTDPSGSGVQPAGTQFDVLGGSRLVLYAIWARTYTLTLSVSPSNTGSTTGSGTYIVGTSVNISAIDGNHYHFDHWSDGNTSRSRTVSITSDITLVAHFAIDRHTVSLSASPADKGAVTISPSGGVYDYGTVVTISATPISHYHFVNWSDGNTSASRTFTVTSNVTLTANFAIDTYSIIWKNWDDSTLETDANAPYGSTPSYDGSTPTRVPTVDTTYSFTGWSPTPVAVTQNAEYIAQYSSAVRTYTVTLSINGNGTVTGAGTYDYGTSVTISATASDGFLFSGWSDGNGNASRTLSITGPVSLTANFAPYSDADILVFSAGGGEFNPNAIHIQSGSGALSYNQEKNAYIWAHVPSSTQVNDGYTIVFDMPYDSSHGITPPPGMGPVMMWTTTQPYFKYDVTLDGQGHAYMTYEIKKRKNSDILVNRTFYPMWTPHRGTKQSAMLVTPGYGIVDLGNIQSISETYEAKLSTIPIVCYGYSGAFCMDLGVFKQVSIDFIRTCPPYDQCDNSSADSKLWTTAKWISYLKTIMDRWQMMSNGSLLYLLRPATERPTEDINSYYDDPMEHLYTEIVGDPCYVTQLPIIYNSQPQSISGKISLQIGTVYPRSPESERITIRYTLDATAYGKSVIVKDVEYPLVDYILLPSVTEIFGSDAMYVDSQTTLTKGYIAAQWRTASGTTLNTKEVYAVSDIKNGNSYELYAVLAEIAVQGGTALITRTSTLHIVPRTAGYSMTVSCFAVGGGGGGGGGDITDGGISSIGTSHTHGSIKVSGGGGGASGCVGTGQWTFLNKNLTVTCTIGQGGTGGQGGRYRTTGNGAGGQGPKRNDSEYAGNGQAGDATILKINDGSLDYTIYANGGAGGEAAAHSQTPSTTDLSEPRGRGGVTYIGNDPDPSSMPGGDGGNGAAGTNGGSSADTGNAGAGGRYIEETYTYKYIPTGLVDDCTFTQYISGGGGGGASYCATPNIKSNCKGGAGASPSSSISDHTTSGPTTTAYGAGGGGGGGVREYDEVKFTDGQDQTWAARPYYGRNGGNGYCYIIVSNGIIMGG